MQKLKKGQFVELIITSATLSQFQFDRQQYLEDKHIVAIEAYSVTDFAKVPTSLSVLVNTTTFANSFIVLSFKGRENFELIPLNTMRRAANNGLRFDCDINDIEWSKSYVRIVSQASQVAGESFGFTFFYEDKI